MCGMAMTGLNKNGPVSNDDGGQLLGGTMGRFMPA